VSLKETADITDTQIDEVHGKGELSFVVQHQAVEIAKAAKAVKKATKKVKQAKEDYRKYQKDLASLKTQRDQLQTDYNNKVPGLLFEDIVDLNSLIDEVGSDKEWYQAGIVLAAANLTSKATLLYQQTAAGSISGLTFGFNAGIQIDLDASKTATNTHSEVSRGSLLAGENITIQTGNNGDITQTATQITGSHLQAAKDIAITTGKLTVEASRNDNSFNTKTEQASIRIAQTLYGAAGGPTISADYSRSKANDKDTSYNNSTLKADNINLSSTEDTTINGANIKAEDTLNLEVGENLAVQSKQNRYSADNKSFGISAGSSLGKDGTGDSKTVSGAASNLGKSNGEVSSVSGGLNASNDLSRTKQTVLTDIIGDTVNINVAKNTQLIGSTTAAKDANGKDNGQLTIKTQTFDYADLSNTSFDRQRSAGISTSVGIGDKQLTKEQKATQVNDPNRNQTIDAKGEQEARLNTSNIAYSNNSSYSKNKTLATLGQGTVTIADDDVTGDDSTERLNRDTENTTKELYSIDRQQGNVDLTIDTRLLSVTGRDEIRQQIAELPANLEIIADSILDKFEQLTDSSQVISPAHYEALQTQIREELAALSPDDRKRVSQQMGIFMDGTGNDRPKDIANGTETNVAIMSLLYADDDSNRPLYYPGVGTIFGRLGLAV
jgi:hypothetical protein